MKRYPSRRKHTDRHLIYKEDEVNPKNTRNEWKVRGLVPAPLALVLTRGAVGSTLEKMSTSLNHFSAFLSTIDMHERDTLEEATCDTDAVYTYFIMFLLRHVLSSVLRQGSSFLDPQ